MDEVKDGFLVDIRAQNANAGRRTLFYVRDRQSHSYVIERDVDNYFVSDRLSFTEADELEKSLRGTSLIQYNPKILASGSMYIVVLSGPRELKSDPEFKKATKNHSMAGQPDRSLRLRYPVLSVVENGVLQRKKKVTPEILLGETSCGFDLEFTGLNTPLPLPYISAIPSSKDNIVFTTNDTGVTSIDIDGYKVRIERVGSIDELFGYSEQFISELDPLWIDGQNIMNCDLPIARLHHDFEIGVCGTRQKIEGGVPGFNSFSAGKERTRFEKVVVPGRYVIDLLPWARNNIQLPNYRLGTITSYLGFDFEKAFKGEELDSWAEKAKYDPEIALALAVYCFRDAKTTSKIAQFLRPQIIREALDFNTDPTTICFTSNAVTKFYDQATYAALGTLRKRRSTKLDANARKLELLEVS